MIKRLRNEDGAAAIEFALVLPLLLVVLFGIVEFGRVFSQYQVFQGAAREGGRYAAVRDPSGVGPGAAAVRTRVVNSAEPYQGNISSGSIAVSTQCTSTTVGSIVKVSWTQPATVAIPLLPTWNVSLPIKSAFRCE